MRTQTWNLLRIIHSWILHLIEILQFSTLFRIEFYSVTSHCTSWAHNLSNKSVHTLQDSYQGIYPTDWTFGKRILLRFYFILPGLYTFSFALEQKPSHGLVTSSIVVVLSKLHPVLGTGADIQMHWDYLRSSGSDHAMAKMLRLQVASIISPRYGLNGPCATLLLSPLWSVIL